jgi:hypothetical protein
MEWSKKIPELPGYYKVKIEQLDVGYLCTIYYDGELVWIMNLCCLAASLVKLWGPRDSFPELPESEKGNMYRWDL